MDNIPAVDQIVAALDSDEWYVGKVLEVDLADRDAKITFMVRKTSKTATTFKWPHPHDVIWIPFDDILTVVSHPTPLGKSERTFQYTPEQFTLIEGLASVAKNIISK